MARFVGLIDSLQQQCYKQTNRVAILECQLRSLRDTEGSTASRISSLEALPKHVLLKQVLAKHVLLKQALAKHVQCYEQTDRVAVLEHQIRSLRDTEGSTASSPAQARLTQAALTQRIEGQMDRLVPTLGRTVGLQIAMEDNRQEMADNRQEMACTWNLVDSLNQKCYKLNNGVLDLERQTRSLRDTEGSTASSGSPVQARLTQAALTQAGLTRALSEP
ncbi:hypothetical protein IE81DRAFT_349653 [Ceraceosorus guamensis]|uniref:Uncharacterized protein n=1 Tax=Ceraceosorus guamensis TaxID=1522189 RepID=A0A316VU96_9BASI|nr:hypothetical protein IE81DRAFT_349653 [Ceraceosorus guamensis]PWN40003.1 hypothetical protein IE81DRAFT_349653 [Ceraceosorus guamensis]